MRSKRLKEKNSLKTPGSETTLIINYDEKHQVLEVEFTGGRIYHYKKVEPEVWEEYKAEVNSGGSSGIFVNTRIKPFYEYEEVCLEDKKHGRKSKV
jgi:hypothetical protein